MADKLKGLLFPSNIRDYKDDYNRVNIKALTFLLVSGLLLSLVFCVFGYFLKAPREIMAGVVCYLFFFGISCGMRVTYNKDIIAHGTVSLYIWSSVILLFTLFLTLGAREDSLDYMYYFFLFLLPLLIRDSWGNVMIFLLAGAFMILLVEHGIRNTVTFGMCVIHVIITMTASAFLSFRASTERLSIMASHSKAEDQAEHDPLTGIFNRRGGEQMIRAYLASEIAGAFMIIDVDNFKHVNDTYGHAEGDRVLVKVAQTLKNTFRESDVVMRMGGDEFIVYATGMADVSNVENRLSTLVSGLHAIVLNEETGDHVTASIGCIVNLGSYPNYESLSAAADRLLYTVKEGGKDHFICSNKDFA